MCNDYDYTITISAKSTNTRTQLFREFLCESEKFRKTVFYSFTVGPGRVIWSKKCRKSLSKVSFSYFGLVSNKSSILFLIKRRYFHLLKINCECLLFCHFLNLSTNQKLTTTWWWMNYRSLEKRVLYSKNNRSQRYCVIYSIIFKFYYLKIWINSCSIWISCWDCERPYLEEI